MRKFEVGQRVAIVSTELYFLSDDQRAGVVVDTNFEGRGDIEIVVDNYTDEEPYAGGWDTLAFSPHSLRAEKGDA